MGIDYNAKASDPLMEQFHTFAVALPDAEGTERIAGTVRSAATTILNHPSGRPWLLIRTQHSNDVRHIDHPFPIALVGSTSATNDELAKTAGHIHTRRDLPQFSRIFDGSFTVFSSFKGEAFVNGPALQSRKTFHTVIDGIRVVADRADVLASLGNLPIDDVALATKLARGVPHPTQDISMWSGINQLPGPNFLSIRADGRSYDTGIWWSRPQPVFSREESAARLRDALETAVAARTLPHDQVSCDLSGGLDSTPICYFAAKGPSGVVARTFYTEDPGGREDLDWAKRAMSSMPGVRHHEVFSTAGLPEFYEGLNGLGIPIDEPTQAGGTIPRIRHMLDNDLSQGVTAHLNGIGGDHLFRGVGSWNHTIARSRPKTAWDRARAENIPLGIGRLTTLRQLRNRSSYAQWHRLTVQRAFAHQSIATLPAIDDWSVPLELPTWLSPEARGAIHDQIMNDALSVEPLDADLAGHFDLYTIHQATALTRTMSQVGHALGVNYEAPLMDDHVVEAVLGCRYEERDTPLEWKPLMKAAMRGHLPDDYLRRTTKIGGGAQTVRGYAGHYQDLRHLWEDSGLLDSGLIDIDEFDKATLPSTTSAPTSHVHSHTNVAIFLQAWNATNDRQKLQLARNDHE